MFQSSVSGAVRARLFGLLDLGGDVGINAFEGNGFGGFKRLRIDGAADVAVLRLLPRLATSSFASLVRLTLRLEYMPGELSGADFGVPDSPFRVSGESRWSVGWMVDFGALGR